MLVSKVEAMEGDERDGGGDGTKFTREDRFWFFDLGLYELRRGRNWFASQRVGNHVMRWPTSPESTEMASAQGGRPPNSMPGPPSVVRSRLLESFGAI